VSIPYQYLRTRRELDQFCEQLRDQPCIAVDTEFVGDHSYFRRLEILQVAAPGLEAIIDYPAISGGGADPGSLDSLWAIFAAPTPELVFHAVTEDARVLLETMGRLPVSVFDTQVAWSLVDQRFQIGYLDLVETLCGVRLDKGPQMQDWTRRPLTNEMIEYALNDVRYLLPLREKLLSRLEQAGRTEWLQEIQDEILEDVRPPDPGEAWRRVKGAGGLTGRQHNALRQLAMWRENLAMDRNEPPHRLVADDILVAVARKMPRNESALRQVTRRLHDGLIRSWGADMLRAVETAANEPPPPREQTSRTSPGEHTKGLQALLSAYAEAIARHHGVATSRLARSSELGELAALAESPDAAAQSELRLLRGWRRELLGEDLLAILRGELRLHWDPRELCLVAERR